MSDAMVKEVRLGLVCYGGVSLAVYMHGLTKEVFKLVRAARAFDRAHQDGNFDPDRYFSPARGATAAGAEAGAGAEVLPDCDSERAYFAALKALADADKPVTVVVDVIAGTSAGGINGVCLARGLAEGRSLEGFRQLWLDEGDMTDLLAGHAFFPWGKAKMLSQLADSVARLWHRRREALLNGDQMCRFLYDALDGMALAGPSLIRPDESLDLFVTATNVHGYETVIPTGAGGYSHTDRSYRQLMHFSYQQESPSVAQQEPLPAAQSESPPEAGQPGTDFGDVPSVAFAARATASFPGAFPPVSLGSFLHAVGPGADPGRAGPPDDETVRAQIAKHFVYGPEYATAAEQWFMDGGVLDNGPFDHVIDAIAAKRADGPTAREIIYLEPDPGPPIKPPPAARRPAEPSPADHAPTFAETVWASRVTIPWHTSMAAVLEGLETMNAAIAEVGDLVKVLSPAVLRALQTAASAPGALDGQAGYDNVTQNAEQIRAAARTLTGDLGYGTYCRLRGQTLAESFGVTMAAKLGFPSDSSRSNFIVAVFGAWERQQKSWAADDDTSQLEAMLGPVDVPFRLRRAEFILQGINDQFRDSDEARHEDLVAIKKACWSLICELRAKQQKVASMVRDQALALFGPQALSPEGCVADPASFARDRGQDLTALYKACLQAVTRTGVQGTSQDLWDTLITRTGSWDQAHRTSLLARYVGFPIWDSLIFPEVALARLPQLTPITVHRFSPLDATCLQAVDQDGRLKTEDPAAKLDGVSYSHFGAFFEKPWRENDYLWGRLDGAELILRLLSRQSGADLDLTEQLRSALTAILGTEQDQLTEIGPVSRALAEQVANIKDGSMAERPG